MPRHFQICKKAGGFRHTKTHIGLDAWLAWLSHFLV
jgi:hypothetical protein